MNSTCTAHTPPPLFPFTTRYPKRSNFAIVIKRQNKPKLRFSSRSNHNHATDFHICSSTSAFLTHEKKRHNLSRPCYTVGTTTAVRDRLQLLLSEFESLTEPIERVKRLLDYASRVPPFEEAARSPANRVTGCTTQVWLEAAMDDERRMRFTADSDSEITKGFIWCLIWALDGAEPEEVVAVKAEDLAAINVGLYGKAQSRVNTWHNVLTAMQNRTKDLLAKPMRVVDETLPPLILAPDGVGQNGKLLESQVYG